jgi:hypothetical protein
MVVGIGIALSLHSNVNRIVFDAASIADKETKEGNLKRCRYLRESSSVARLYSSIHQNYLKSRLRIIEAIMRDTDVIRTSSGRIFTPSVSSSKKRSSPALEAGNGAFFFFLPLIFSCCSFRGLWAF